MTNRKIYRVHITKFGNARLMAQTLTIKPSFSITSSYTVKLVYNDHPWDSKIVAVVDRWSLLRGHLFNKSSIWDLKIVVAIWRWSFAQV